MKTNKPKFASFEEMKDSFPETVYKYRRWNNEIDKRVITNGELYFASPRDFEDQEDCRQAIDYSTLAEDQKLIWAIEVTKKNYPHLSPTIIPERARRLLIKAPINDPIKAKELSDQHQEKYFDITGVLSLTGNLRNDKMWNKYADEHKGFCVGFNSIELFKSGVGGSGADVKYVDKLPTILPMPFMDSQTQAFYQIFHKEKKWAFEEEYRLHMIRDKKLEINDRRKYPPAEAFKEIIIGKNMPEEDYEELIKNIPDELSHVKIIRL